MSRCYRSFVGWVESTRVAVVRYTGHSVKQQRFTAKMVELWTKPTISN